MAFRRSLSTTGILNLRGLCLRPSNCDTFHGRRDESMDSPPDKSQFLSENYFMPAVHSASASNMTGSQFGARPCFSLAAPIGIGIGFPYSSRYMSSTSAEDSSSSASEILAEVLTERTVDVVASQVPDLSEVAVAAADSAFPVAALQHLIDSVHSFTGFDWWAAIIALTTLLIRLSTIPMVINLKRMIAVLKPLISQFSKDLNRLLNRLLEDSSEAEIWRVMSLLKKYGVHLKELAIISTTDATIGLSYIFAIINMAERVPSFHTGGALWFVDLTTNAYILPLLNALAGWIVLKVREPNQLGKWQFYHATACFMVPVMIGFPQAMYIHWLTSNIFRLCFDLVVKQPAIQKFLSSPKAPGSST